MTDEAGLLDVTIVLVNEGYISTAVGPIEVFASAGAMWEDMCGRTPRPRFRVTMASIDGTPVKSAYGLRIAPNAGIDAVEKADVLFVSASGALPSDWMPRHRRLLPWLADWHER
jgi:transcriptional regulator GlxA family with amidase domain